MQLSNKTQHSTALPPLSLYVHIPWCVRKCPYCDFNSHTSPATLPVQDYVDALIVDLQNESVLAQGRKLTSIFFGGGTPSLFPANAIDAIIAAAENQIGFREDIEITLEANPGTTEYTNFSDLLGAGVNRLSVGVQSFNDAQLQALGRIHRASEAERAIKSAQDAGFTNINIDLMHGLPQQSLKNAEQDIKSALNLAPQHISWYQLTIEPNTQFYSSPPTLPTDESLWAIQQRGLQLLDEAGFKRYEISAYCRENHEAKHNLNYWRFGDYLGIGAGAHGKITHDGTLYRTNKTRLPADYLTRHSHAEVLPETKLHAIDEDHRVIDFMMNILRLREGAPTKLFGERTGLPYSKIAATIQTLQEKGFLINSAEQLKTTDKGFDFLNTVLEEFMPE